MSFDQKLNELNKLKNEVNLLTEDFWSDYSNLGTWQFWVILSLLLIPIIILYFAIDRKRIFEIFFFGYTVHILWSYLNIMLERYSFMVHPYSLTPVLPYALNITTSFLPVGFLLVYQYCTNNKKNYYLYTIALSAIFAFGFAPVEMSLGLLQLNKGLNFFYIFIIDIVIAFVAYLFTKMLLKWKGKITSNISS